jgi:hypothetical protein
MDIRMQTTGSHGLKCKTNANALHCKRILDSLQVYTGATSAAVYDPSTGGIIATGQNQSIMLGSTSRDAITSFTLAAGASDGGAEGYTVFVGLTTATPEPSSLGMVCLGATGFCLYARRRRKRAAQVR